jgi:uncharacterized protein (UPF0305 family)
MNTNLNAEMLSMVSDYKLDIPKFLKQLKDESLSLDIFQFSKLASYLEKEGRYLPEGFKKEFIKESLNHFFTCWMGFRNLNLQNVFDVLNDDNMLGLPDDLISFFESTTGVCDDPVLKKMLLITVIYSIIKKIPIHPLTIPFPAGKKIYERNGSYYCPVKENHKDDLFALCRFCIARPEDGFKL